MSFQQTADPAVAYCRSRPPQSGRFAGALTGGVLIAAVLAGAAVAGPVKSGTSGAGGASGDWSLCRRAASEMEDRISAPAHLLSAVTLTETGRRVPGGKSLQAWPWTINTGGKGYVFKTKAAAVRAVRRLMAQGRRSIDIGCMQVNLKYHPRAFTSLEEAFDPLANLAYGADFLLRLKRRHGSWDLAVQHYHSYTDEYRESYAARFRTLWAMERRRMAKADGRADSTLARLPEIPAVSDSEWLRRLKPVAALMAFGINLGALDSATDDGNAFLRRLGGRYPDIADSRTRSAALARPVPVN